MAHFFEIIFLHHYMDITGNNGYIQLLTKTDEYDIPKTKKLFIPILIVFKWTMLIKRHLRMKRIL